MIRAGAEIFADLRIHKYGVSAGASFSIDAALDEANAGRCTGTGSKCEHGSALACNNAQAAHDWLIQR